MAYRKGPSTKSPRALCLLGAFLAGHATPITGRAYTPTGVASEAIGNGVELTENDMIIWGSGGGGADLGEVQQQPCPTCEKVRPFKIVLQYKYAHLYYLRWVTEKKYHLACEICHRGWELKSEDVESKLQTNPIPFMTRYGWLFLVAIVASLGLILASGK